MGTRPLSSASTISYPETGSLESSSLTLDEKLTQSPQLTMYKYTIRNFKFFLHFFNNIY